jgi:hypothetical protein
MVRNLLWIAVATTLLNGSLALAQGTARPLTDAPYGNPGSYGYPGYGIFPYGAPQQPLPGQPMSMPLPYGQSPRMPIPYVQPQPFAPIPGNQPWVPPLPQPNGKGSEPKSLPVPEPKVERRAPPAEPEIVYQGISTIGHVEDEPYTLYEGQRYQAAIKHDNSHAWAQVSYIHWWLGGVRSPALVVTPTSVLGGNLAPREFSGIQASFGEWLDADHYTALEIAGFWLGKHRSAFTFRTDGAGNPPIGLPILAPDSAVALITGPGFASGSVTVNNIVDFHGLELNMVQNVLRVNGWTLDHFVGLRYLYLKDTLTMDTSATSLADGVLFFNGTALPAGSTVGVSDRFGIRNRFYGGQVGARLSWTWCDFEIGAAAKLGFGATRRTATIEGASTNFTTNETLAGGLLAQPSNSGRHGTTHFSFVPEIGGTVSWQATPCIRLLAGYSFLYWTRVQRASEQVVGINLSQPPTSPIFAAGSGGPIFPANRSDFWAHGINLGVELKY